MEQSLLRPLTAGEIIRGAFRLYGESLSTAVILALMAQVPVLLLGSAISTKGQPSILAVIGLLVLTLTVTGVMVSAITLAAAGAVSGRPLTVGGAIAAALSRSAAAVLVGFLLSNIISHLGLIPVIIPGLLIGGLLAATVPAILVEEKGPFSGLGRSLGLLRQAWMKGIAVFTFGLLVSVVLPLALTVGLELLVGQSPFSPLLAAVLGAVTLPLALIANLLLYVSARVGEGGGDSTEALRAQLVRMLPAERAP